uniref:Homeobox domain-containing protein n=1 Tax=Salix viminalis TaxID=40686 RepID=A0A6N2KPI4_SALVM
MEDNQDLGCNSPSNHGAERSQPVRSRWTPKPEQILILESIFNSGMVNPSKNETVRIRKLLENFGSVGDSNVFYWFQNRRSRSRRRRRQMQASLVAGDQRNNQPEYDSRGAIQYEGGGTSTGFANSPSVNLPYSYLAGSSSSCGVVGEDHGVESLFSFSNQMGFQELNYQTAGFITVFINGVPAEVPSGPLDVKAMFGQDFMLVNSSGVPVPTDESGFSAQILRHGESYFLVNISGV